MRRVTNLALFGVIGALISVLMVAVTPAQAVTCGGTSRVSYTSEYVGIGDTFTALDLSTTAISLGGSVQFHPAGNYYRYDTWSYGYDLVGSVNKFYFSYRKVANPGTAAFMVSWCNP
jgi:hypothetical protein